jgi:hypothetical protein
MRGSGAERQPGAPSFDSFIVKGWGIEQSKTAFPHATSTAALILTWFRSDTAIPVSL